MKLTPLAFADLPGWSDAEAEGAWPVFRKSADAVMNALPELRRGLSASPQLREIMAQALQQPAAGSARAFFESRFKPHLVSPKDEAGGEGFLTGYYEPEVDGSLEQTPAFSTPMLARPDDLIDLRGADAPPGWNPRIEGARRRADGGLEPYPTRAEIEAGAIAAHTRPICWLRDPVELFFIQVQGSARVRLPDGQGLRIVYDGRNGRPYSSIGKALIADGAMSVTEMSLARLKQWLRDNGLKPGERARAVMQRNESYIFFRIDPALGAASGPIGAQGVPLTPLRSLAVDRNLWPYGAPVWIEADIPHASLSARKGRLWIAQDTGSAIIGPARGDLFIGTGDKAGAAAGNIRHSARFVIFLPI
ncbi:MAG: MltA domain-containing protein [Hyphomicrobiales bacterium]|nr:MltA domain-containing protein [Hyphomicrobiales bacterium]